MRGSMQALVLGEETEAERSGVSVMALGPLPVERWMGSRGRRFSEASRAGLGLPVHLSVCLSGRLCLGSSHWNRQPLFGCVGMSLARGATWRDSEQTDAAVVTCALESIPGIGGVCACE